LAAPEKSVLKVFINNVARFGDFRNCSAQSEIAQSLDNDNAEEA